MYREVRLEEGVPRTAFLDRKGKTGRKKNPRGRRANESRNLVSQSSNKRGKTKTRFQKNERGGRGGGGKRSPRDR